MNNHIMSKTIIITHVIELISKEYKVSLDEARDMLYNSETIKSINNTKTGLYGESLLYSFSIFKKEFNSKK